MFSMGLKRLCLRSFIRRSHNHCFVHLVNILSLIGSVSFTIPHSFSRYSEAHLFREILRSFDKYSEAHGFGKFPRSFSKYPDDHWLRKYGQPRSYLNGSIVTSNSSCLLVENRLF